MESQELSRFVSFIELITLLRVLKDQQNSYNFSGSLQSLRKGINVA